MRAVRKPKPKSLIDDCIGATPRLAAPASRKGGDWCAVGALHRSEPSLVKFDHAPLSDTSLSVST